MKLLKTNSEGFALLSAILWGFNYPNTRLILSRLTPAEMLLLRYPAAAFLLLLCLKGRGEDFRPHRSNFSHPSDLMRLLFLGVVGVGVYNVIWTNAIGLTSAANAALWISFAPVITTCYAALWGGEIVSRRRWLGVLTACAGIALVTLTTPGAQLRLDSAAFVGNLLGLTAALIFAAYNILAAPLLKHTSPLKLTTQVTALGLVVLIPYGLWGLDGAHLATAFRSGAPALPAELFYLVLAGTVLAYVFWYRGIRHAGPSRTVIYHYLVSVISMSVGACLLAEIPSTGQVIGAGLVLAGLLITKVLPEHSAEAVPDCHESPAGLMENHSIK